MNISNPTPTLDQILISVNTFTRSQNNGGPIFSTIPYVLVCNAMQRVTQIRDLGVTFDTKLTMNTHIIEVFKRAYKALCFVLRQLYQFRDRNVFYIFITICPGIVGLITPELKRKCATLIHYYLHYIITIHPLLLSVILCVYFIINNT